MAKYDPLRDYLLAVPTGQLEVSMTFTEVGRLVGGLPESAFKFREWWANDSKVEAQAWRAAGWHVTAGGVDRNAGTVRFARGRVGGSNLARRQATADGDSDDVGPRFDLVEYFTTEQDRIAGHLTTYFDGDPNSRFTGRWFELHAARTDPNRFEAGDVIAVEALSVSVPPEAAARLLFAGGGFEDLLLQIPRGLALWEAGDVIGSGRPASDLHAALTGVPGIGWVTAGKLMAAKRPALIPVYDALVRDLLHAPDGFWAYLQAVLEVDEDRAIIEKATAAAPEHVSLLRRIDVALWMHARDLRQATGVDE